MPHHLALVTSVANQLLAANPANAAQVNKQVLASLVEGLDLDFSFSRRNDHDIRASFLVAEWPPRSDVANPDPFAVVHFSSADPVFALADHGKKTIVIKPDQLQPQHWLARRHPGTPPWVAVAPLVSHEVTTGALGVVKFGGRKWQPDVIDTLEAVATLLAQFQTRVTTEQTLRQLVDHDDLTGLLNRRSLVEHVSGRLAAGRAGPVTVLYVDLDRLKAVNDCFGHTAGDWFIQVFAKQLRTCAGSDSLVARLGGDEFVVVPDRPMRVGAAESLAGRLLEAVSGRVTIDGQTISRTVSIGVGVGVPGRDSCRDLLHQADEAVLTAKRAGGNQVAAAKDSSLTWLFRHKVKPLLRGGIDSDALEVHYLPEVDLWTGGIVAIEAQLRWRHPTHGLLAPDSVVGVAESMNLAGALGSWIMRRACADFSRWRSRGMVRNATLRINVSPAQLVSRDFTRSVAGIIEKVGIDTGSVCLEITERALVRDVETIRQTLHELKELGVQIALDDFGTGYAVLSHLKIIPVDTLKIDGQFVRELGTNAADLAIVRAVVGLAQAFGLQVVAEGVETAAAALTLMDHGCHRAQGELLSRLLPAGAVESLLCAGRLSMPFLADRESLGLRAV